MVRKVEANVQKVSMIYCCIRECFSLMNSGEIVNVTNPGVSFKVMPVDVEAAWDVCQMSMHTFKQFKVLS